MSQQNVEPLPSRLLVIATVSFYLVAALTMVIANKWVLSTTDAPLFFLFAQLLVAVVLFLLAHALRLLTLPFVFSAQRCRGLAPMVCVNVLGLSFNNYTLKYVDASFYQVARGLVLPATVLLSHLFLAARPSPRALLACALVSAGFFLGVLLDTADTSAPPAARAPHARAGIAFGLLSSVTTAASAVLIKRSLPAVAGSTLHLAWYNNALSAALLLPLLLLAGEGPAAAALLAAREPAFLAGALLTGVVGFLISIAGFLSIKVTSPITHMVSSAVRGVVVSLLGVWFFHDVVTAGRAASILAILAGSVYYTYVKSAEAGAAPPPAQQYVPLDTLERGAGKEKA